MSAEAGLYVDLKSAYAISERMEIVAAFQGWARRVREKFPSISNLKIALIVDDVLLSADLRVRIDDGEAQSFALSGVLHLRTIGNILKREIDIHLSGLHLQTVQVLDAFLQLLRQEPPEYLDAH